MIKVLDLRHLPLNKGKIREKFQIFVVFLPTNAYIESPYPAMSTLAKNTIESVEDEIICFIQLNLNNSSTSTFPLPSIEL